MAQYSVDPAAKIWTPTELLRLPMIPQEHRIALPMRLAGYIIHCVLAVAGFLPAHAYAQRVALLIGNANYQAGPLSNPLNDLRAMEAALREVGFKVQAVRDADQASMKRAVRDFGELAHGAEVALFYYSGHGTQALGENYLIPVRSTIRKESDYEVEAVSANSVMKQIVGARPKTAIVVLDACRDNPFAANTKSVSKGLGRMDAPTGTMIAFATAPNTTAGDEGHYARVLAQQIRTPGLELYDVFRNTTAEVQRLSNGSQVPRVSEVSITERIYLAGQTRAPSVLPSGGTPLTNSPAQQVVLNKPTPDEIKKFYDANPALFSQRRIYNLYQIDIEAKPDQFPQLKERLSSAKDIDEFIAYLKIKKFRFTSNQETRAADQLPVQGANAFAKMSDGQVIVMPAPGGQQVILLKSSRSEPLTLEQARPAIEQAIIEQRSRKLVTNAGSGAGQGQK